MGTLANSQLCAGDIGLSTDNSWMAKGIKWFESMWTGKAFWSHAYALINHGEVVEALGRISRNPISKYDSKIIAIFRIPITDQERAAVSAGLIARVNGAYGWLKYPLFIMDASTTWIKQHILRMKNPCFFFTNTLGISNIPVCSQLVVWAIHKFTSYRFRDAQGQVVNWRCVTPDYLEDLLLLPINRAVKIFSSK